MKPQKLVMWVSSAGTNPAFKKAVSVIPYEGAGVGNW